MSEQTMLAEIFQTYSTRLFTIGLGLASTVLTARLLGPDGRGLYAFAMTISMLGIQFGNLGLHAANTFYLSKDRSLLPTLVGNSIIIGLAVGFIVALASFFLSPLTSAARSNVPWDVVVLMMITIPAGLSAMFLQNLLLATNNVKQFNLTEIAGKLAVVAAIAALSLLGAITPFNLIGMAGFSSVLIIILAYHWLLPSGQRKIRVSLRTFVEFVPYGLKAYLAALFSFLLFRVDILMIRQILGDAATGEYSIAVNVSDLLLILPAVTGSILFPKLSALSDVSLKWSTTKRLMLPSIIVYSAATGIVAMLSSPIVYILFGSSYLAAGNAIKLMAPGILFASINAILMNFYAAIGMPLITVIAPLLALLLNIGLNLRLVPTLGIAGASISTTISYGTSLIISLAYLAAIRARLKIAENPIL